MMTETTLCRFSQIPTGIHIKSISLVSQIATVQHGDDADADLRQRNMDIVSEARKMIKIAQRKMLRLIVRTKRHYKTIKKGKAKDNSMESEEKPKENDPLCVIDEETGEGSKQSSNKNQNSDVSLQEVQDEEIEKCEKEEEWFEFIKRSTKEFEEHMKKMKILCWIETHRRMKWRMAMRIASLSKERWTSTIIEWIPGLDDNKIKTNRIVGRPRKRWEDDINEFLRPEEKEDTKGNDLK